MERNDVHKAPFFYKSFLHSMSNEQMGVRFPSESFLKPYNSTPVNGGREQAEE